jgi:PHD/YefM family antitoxin component YafN of YafNO toxin-antitoxin module
MHMKVSTAEFIKNYGTLADKALIEPLTITKNGRDRLVLVEASEFERLKRRDRQVKQLTDFTDDDMARIAHATAQGGHDPLDEELIGWKP